ncbi:MAG: L,D-transpeptidase [Pseudonocardia sp.]|nr:L,D-transpeptidase [Pseudonocardia sp.]
MAGRSRVVALASLMAGLVVLAGTVLAGVGAAAPAEDPAPAAATGAPGLLAPSRARAAAPATAAAQGSTPGPALVAGTTCTATARACVDRDTRRAWLLDAGEIARGPVRVQTGDDEDPTPLGTFTVQWKAKEYTSREYLTQMPYSVFFADGGIAFHEGRQDTPSAGCVKLLHTDAVAWFDHLVVGDEVQIT